MKSKTRVNTIYGSVDVLMLNRLAFGNIKGSIKMQVWIDGGINS